MEKNYSNYDYNYWEQGSISRQLCLSCRETVNTILDNSAEKLKMDLRIVCVDSQPGDATKYSYFVYREGYDRFHFMPKNNTFKYPQRLSYFECKDMDTSLRHEQKEGHEEDSLLIELSEKHDCNPWTLKECIRTMKEIMEKEKNGN